MAVASTHTMVPSHSVMLSNSMPLTTHAHVSHLAQMQHPIPQQQQQQQHLIPQQQQQQQQQSPNPLHSHPLLSGMFNDLVKNEMVNMLNQLFAEMRVETPISLEELCRVNPPLYAQIQSRAEETAQAVLAHRMATQQSSYAQLPPTTTTTNNYPANNNSSFPSSQQSFDYNSRQQSLQATQLIQQQHQQQQQHSYATGQQQQQQSLHHPAPQHSYMHSSDLDPTFHNQLPTNNQLLSSYQQSKKRTIDQDDYQGGQLHLQPQLPLIAHRHHHMMEIDTHHPLQPTTAAMSFPHITADETILLPQTASSSASASSSSSSSSPDDSSLVNGFVCEVPVVLDVGRLHHLVAALDNTSAMKVTDNFRGAVLRVRARLHTYLKDLMVPPKLPSILFGRHDDR